MNTTRTQLAAGLGIETEPTQKETMKTTYTPGPSVDRSTEWHNFYNGWLGKTPSNAIRLAIADHQQGPFASGVGNYDFVSCLRKAEKMVEAHDDLVEALQGMLGNYLELKAISLMVAKSDSPTWASASITAEDDVHVIKARAALAKAGITEN